MTLQRVVVLAVGLVFCALSAQAQEIFDAVKNNDSATVKLLVEKDRALLKAADETGRTPLHWAARGVHAEVLSYLIGAGADVNARDKNGVVPMHSVCSRGHLEAARALIDNGADLTVRMRDGATPLHAAVLSGVGDLVALLVDHGAPLRIRDYKDDTPLHAAAYAGNWGIVGLMAKRLPAPEADAIDLPDFDGNTVLHLACQAGEMETVKAIVSAGADLNIRNAVGQTAYNIAAQGGFREIADFLVGQGAEGSPQRFPRLTGPYLGQTPPDTVPQLFAKGIVSTRIGMYGTIVFSPDGQEAFWRPEIPKTLFMTMENGAWRTPEEFPRRDKEAINVPCYSVDGKRLYFMAPSGEKESIWFVEKDGAGWKEFQPLDSVVNSKSMHWQFSMDRRGDLYYSADKLFCSRYISGRYSEPEALPPIINGEGASDEQYREGNVGPYISPDGDFIIYTKFKAGGPNPVQLFISFQGRDGSWTEPKNMSERLRTEGNDSAARLSPDGKYLFFQSAREGSGASRGLYWVSAKIIDELKPGKM